MFEINYFLSLILSVKATFEHQAIKLSDVDLFSQTKAFRRLDQSVGGDDFTSYTLPATSIFHCFFSPLSEVDVNSSQLKQ